MFLGKISWFWHLSCCNSCNNERVKGLPYVNSKCIACTNFWMPQKL
jgi:hypothetical protein